MIILYSHFSLKFSCTHKKHAWACVEKEVACMPQVSIILSRRDILKKSYVYSVPINHWVIVCGLIVMQTRYWRSGLKHIGWEWYQQSLLENFTMNIMQPLICYSPEGLTYKLRLHGLLSDLKRRGLKLFLKNLEYSMQKFRTIPMSSKSSTTAILQKYTIRTNLGIFLQLKARPHSGITSNSLQLFMNWAFGWLP